MIDNAEDLIVNPETLQFKRAIRDPEQGFKVCERLRYDNRRRTELNARIARKLNDQQPWDQGKLNAAGQRWRNNRSTGFMSSLVARMVPPYKQVVDDARTLTHSKLEDESDLGRQKTDVFRKQISQTIRQWYGWQDFVYRLNSENISYGYTSAVCADEIEWRPILARTDQAFFPDGNPQVAADTPVWCWYDSWLIHEAAKKLEDPELSKKAGWNIDNLVEAINQAKPEPINTGYEADLRKVQDLVRETATSITTGSSYCDGVKVVETYTLFAQEANGKVSKYIYSLSTKKELFSRHDIFDSMSDCLALFAIETGNGKLYGSKGAGRKLYNTHVCIEQARNLAVDNFYLAGLVMLQCTEKAKPDVALTVTHPFMVVPEGYEVIQRQVIVDVSSFISLDRYLTSWAEIQVGAFLPGSYTQDTTGQSEKPTATQVNYVAAIEGQIREGLLKRFWGQFQQMIQMIQKRICSPANIREACRIYKLENMGKIGKLSANLYDLLISLGKTLKKEDKKQEPLCDKEAVDCILAMLRNDLTVEEIFELAHCPSYQASEEITQVETAILNEVVEDYRGNPIVDQKKLTKRHIANKLGNTVAEDLIIDDGDQQGVSENVRMQLMELTSIMEGEPIPVSPRDNDFIHMDVIKEKTGDIFDKAASLQAKEAYNLTKNTIAHFDAHLMAAQAKKLDKAKLQDYAMFSKKVNSMLSQIVPKDMNASIPTDAQPLVPTQDFVADQIQLDPDMASV